MAKNSKYILDANIFIEAKKRYYAFDLCPGFWDSLVHHNSIGNLESIDQVAKIELLPGKDDLSIWAKNESSLFAPTNNDLVVGDYGKIIKWTLSQDRYSDPEKCIFANGVDAWVIAYAKANNSIVVTHEKFAGPNSSKIKIPDICKQFDIAYTDTFVMLRQLGIAFHWNKQ